MNKILSVLILSLAGCASVSAREDVTLSQDFNLDIPTLPSNIIGEVPRDLPLPPVSYSQEVDISDQLSQLNDNEINYNIVLDSDILDCKEGFTAVNGMTLNISNDKKNVDIVPTFSLNSETQHLNKISLPLTTNTIDVLNILRAGSANVTLTVIGNTNGFIDGNIPTHFHNNLKLHLDISFDKSL